MKRTLALALMSFFLVPAVFCTSSLLKLERSETPGGPWQEVPANTLPITVEGAFQDTYESPTGYYHMRIEPGADWGYPLNIPLEDVPPLAKDIATDLLDSLRDGHNGLDDAELAPIAFPMYGGGLTPSFAAPAYVEFALLGPQPEPPDSNTPFVSSNQKLQPLAGGNRRLIIGDTGYPRGYILVSLTEDDFPIISYATEGMTQTERLRRMCGTSAVRVVRYIGGSLVAEDENGNLVSFLGSPPIKYPDEIMDYANVQYEGWVDNDGAKVPNPPPVQGQPFETYGDFQKLYDESPFFQEARSLLKEAAKDDWDVRLGRLPEEIAIPLGQEVLIFENREVASLSLQDPDLATFKIEKLGVLILGKKPGATYMNVRFAGDIKTVTYVLVVGAQTLSVAKPTCDWTSWQYWWADFESVLTAISYTQEDGGDCASGCGATAWTVHYAYWHWRTWYEEWFGGGSGVCRLIGDSAWPPTNHNDDVGECIWYIVPRIETYCSGDQGASNPWDMYHGCDWATHRGCGISHYYRHTTPLLAWTWNGPRDLAIEEVKDHGRPSLVGYGWHLAVAYGYRYRECRGSWTGWVYNRDRYVKVNKGWNSRPVITEWVNAERFWYANRTIVY